MMQRLKFLVFVLSFVLSPSPSFAAPGEITTVMGGWFGNNGPATEAVLNSPADLFVDANGNIYITETDMNHILKIDADTGILTRVAGGGTSIAEDVGSLDARLSGPAGIFVDRVGNIYFSDNGFHRIRRIDTQTGLVTTVAGSDRGFSGDGGAAIAAEFLSPIDVFKDNSGHLYIVDRSNYRVRKIDVLTGIISTIAGNGSREFGGDGGQAVDASFNIPGKVHVDQTGNIYVVSRERVRKIDGATGVITTVAGGGESGDSGIPATSAKLDFPQDMAFDADGNFYVASSTSIYKVDVQTGLLNVLVGGGTDLVSENIDIKQAKIDRLAAIALGPNNSLLFLEGGSLFRRVRKIDLNSGTVTTVAGGTFRDGRPALEVGLFNPEGVFADSLGNVFVADKDNNRVRKLDAQTGLISTVAGTSVSLGDDNGALATEAFVSRPRNVFLDASGNIFFVTTNRVHKVDVKTGVLTTVAGGGISRDDGILATETRFVSIGDIFIDRDGNIYVSDIRNYRIRKIDAATGLISAVAGTGSRGFSGDGGLATEAQFNRPDDIFLDQYDNIYIWDTNNYRVRKVDAETGLLTTVVGGGESVLDWSGTQRATDLKLTSSGHICVDSAGDIFVANWDRLSGYSVFKVDHKTGLTSSIVGPGQGDFSEGALATDILLRSVSGLFVDSKGNLLITDIVQNKVLKVEGVAAPTQLFGPVPLRVQSVVPGQVREAGGATVTVTGRGFSAGVSVTVGGIAATDVVVVSDKELTLTVPAGTLGFATVVVTGADGKVATLENAVRYISNNAGLLTTVGGNGTVGLAGDGALALEARLNAPSDFVPDGNGNYYVADTENHVIRKIDSNGVISTVAGSGTAGYVGDDGVATAASLNRPLSVFLDGAGHIFVADSGNHVIRKIDSNGVITTVVGNGTLGYGGDNGLAKDAQLNEPSDIFIDGVGNVFVADTGNHVVRKVNALGIISTFAGNGTADFSGDNDRATDASLNAPSGVFVDAVGSVFIADKNNHQIRKIVVSPQLDRIGTTGHTPSQGSTIAASITVRNAHTQTITVYWVDSQGDFKKWFDLAPGGEQSQGSSVGHRWVAVMDGRLISQLVVAGAQESWTVDAGSTADIIESIVGNGTAGYSGDNSLAKNAGLSFPSDVFVDPIGAIYIADRGNHRIRKSLFGLISTVAGNGLTNFSDDVLATEAGLSDPRSVFVDGQGNLLFADAGHHRVRKAQGVATPVTLVTGTYAPSGDALTLKGSEPTRGDLKGGTTLTLTGTGFAQGMTVTVGGTPVTNLTVSSDRLATAVTPVGLAGPADIIVSLSDGQQAKLQSAFSYFGVGPGIISTVMGNGSNRFSGDGGLATEAGGGVLDVALDSAGNLFVSSNTRVRKVDAKTGVVTTIAGGDRSGFSGDGGSAINAQLDNVSGVFVDGSGHLFIADSGNNRIRRIDAETGIITTVVGSGAFGGLFSGSFGGDGLLASDALLNYPNDVFIDGEGNLYISDYWNHRIRKVDGSTGIITTVAGNGLDRMPGSKIDAIESSVRQPGSIFVDAAGVLYFSVEADGTSVHKVVNGDISTVFESRFPNIGFGGDGGAVDDAKFSSPIGKLFMDGEGSLYVADGNNHRVRKIANGIVTTVVGSGDANAGGFSGDEGQATDARLNGVGDVFIDAQGNMFVVDVGNHRVRKVQEAAAPTLLAIGTFAPGDGALTVKNLSPPSGSVAGGTTVTLTGTGFTSDVAIAIGGVSASNIVVQSDDVLTAVTPSGTAGVQDVVVTLPDGQTFTMVGAFTYIGDEAGVILTVVGGGMGDDLGLGIEAKLSDARDVVVDKRGNIYFINGAVIRKVNAETGIISTIAGNRLTGAQPGSGGLATHAGFIDPASLAMDNLGNIYVCERVGSSVRKIDVATGLVSWLGSGWNSPVGIAVDQAGNVYVADSGSNQVKKIDAETGAVTVVAGSGEQHPITPQDGVFDGDGGPATQAGFNHPSAVYVDASGHIYIADNGNYRVRKVDATTGIVTTVAGRTSISKTGRILQENIVLGTDGRATDIDLSQSLSDLYGDDDGNLYIAEYVSSFLASGDLQRRRISKVDASTGQLTTLAGTVSGFAGDGGPATEAGLGGATGIFVDGSGNLFIADTNRIRMIRKVASPSSFDIGVYNEKAFLAEIKLDTVEPSKGTKNGGTRITLKGEGFGPQFSTDLTVTIGGVAVDSLSVSSSDREMTAVTPAGTAGVADVVVTHRDGRSVTLSGGFTYIGGALIQTVAGSSSGGFAGDGGPARDAKFNSATGIFVDTLGNIYVTDNSNHRVRKVDAKTGIITTIAGNGERDYAGDGGPATEASLSFPSTVFVDGAGRVFIPDNSRLRMIDETGKITTIAGNGERGYAGDGGPALEAGLGFVSNVFVDASGNIYVGDSTRIWKIDSVTGIITRIAGDRDSWLSTGDGGLATEADFGAEDIFVDGSGNLYIADSAGQDGHRIRKVDAKTGVITTIAGNGTVGFSGDGGPAKEAQLNWPNAVFVDGSGDVYISDWRNGRIRKVDAETGIITTVAGSGEGGSFGDGLPALAVQLFPKDIFIDHLGDLYVTSAGVQVVKGVGAPTPLVIGVFGSEPKKEGIEGDFNGDGSVGFPDFLQFAGAFGKEDAQFDLTGDGKVGFPDFLIFAANFGKSAKVATKVVNDQ